MAIPKDGNYLEEEMDDPVFADKSPVYISSVHYGRLDLICYESEYTHDVAQQVMTSAMVGEELNEEEISILERTKMIGYTIRNRPGVVRPLGGRLDYFDLDNFYLGIGTFEEGDYGTLIGFNLRKLNDHTIVRLEERVTYVAPKLKY